MNMRTSVIMVSMAITLLVTSGCAVTRAPETAPHVDDKAITLTIKARHAESKDVTITNISVETLYGVVLLSGFAKSPQEKIMATTIARQVDGVKAVHDEIIIQPDINNRDAAPSAAVIPAVFL